LETPLKKRKKKQTPLVNLPKKLQGLLLKAVAAKREKRSAPLGDYRPNEVLQLGEEAVRNRLPPGVTKDDMRAALGRCGMRVNDVIYELAQRVDPGLDDAAQAAVIVDILFEAFDSALLDVVAHKA
jgi:hypothetical protein